MTTENETATETLKGKAKEALGKLTGSDELAKEGEAQQEKAEAREKAERAEQKQERHSGV